MYFAPLQVLALIVTIGCASASVYAEVQTQEEHFKAICVESWMSRLSDNANKANFRIFGEKYCQCGINKTLKDENDLKNVVQQCMSETVIQTTMHVVEDKQGLSNVSSSGIDTACQNEWKLVYPQMDEENRRTSIAHCQCVAPRIDELNKNRGTLTTHQYVEKLNAIADHCATFVAVAGSKAVA